MALVIEGPSGDRAPAGLALHIDAGLQPSGYLEIQSMSGKHMRLHLGFGDLVSLCHALATDSRLTVDKSKWTDKDRRAYDDALDRFIGSIAR